MGAVNVIFKKQTDSNLLEFVQIQNDAGTETHQEEWRDLEDGTISLRISTLFYDENKTDFETATQTALRVWRAQLPGAKLGVKIQNVLQNLRDRNSF